MQLCIFCVLPSMHGTQSVLRLLCFQCPDPAVWLIRVAPLNLYSLFDCLIKCIKAGDTSEIKISCGNIINKRIEGVSVPHR